MFIIFGWGKTTKPVEPLLKNHCYRCNNESQWVLLRETQWISLFFVRVIPFLHKYFLSCEICGDSAALVKNAAKEILVQNNRNQALHDELVGILEDHQCSDLTEGQENYRKSQVERGNNA